MNELQHNLVCKDPRVPLKVRKKIHKIKYKVPSALHRGLENGKSASMRDHILIEQILEVSVIYFYDTSEAMTKQGDMQ